MNPRKLVVLYLSIGVFLVAFGVVQAKWLPYVEGLDQDWGGIDQPFAIPKARGALTLNGNLNSPKDIDAFAYTFKDPAKSFPFELDVPSCGASNVDFYPTAALVGPGLPAPETDAELPFTLPEGAGVLIFTIEHARVHRYAYATYGPELYVIGQQKSLFIPKAATYLLVVWEPDGHVGPYIVATGDQEPDFENMTSTEIDTAFQREGSGQWVKDSCAAIPAELAATPEATPTATESS